MTNECHGRIDSFDTRPSHDRVTLISSRDIKRLSKPDFGPRLAHSSKVPLRRMVDWLFLPGARMFVAAARVNHR